MGCQGVGLGTSGRMVVLQVVCLASSMWALASAQPPPPTAPCGSCSRHWITTVWGFVTTMVVLTVDFWGLIKNRERGRRILTGIFTIVVCILNPIYPPLWRVAGSVESRRKANRLGDLYPTAKAHVKILWGCEHVVVFLSPTADQSTSGFTFYNSALSNLDVDLSDAVVIGRAPEPDRTSPVLLTGTGMEALVRADVLPPPEQLNVLQGSSGIAQAISALQAVGYMWGVAVRIGQHLEVSSIEAVAFSLNIVVLVKAFMHYYSSTCHGPLVLYLDAAKEAKFMAMCQKQELIKTNFVQILFWTSLLAVLEGCSFSYFIVKISKSNPFVTVVPLIIVGCVSIFPPW